MFPVLYSQCNHKRWYCIVAFYQWLCRLFAGLNNYYTIIIIHLLALYLMILIVYIHVYSTYVSNNLIINIINQKIVKLCIKFISRCYGFILDCVSKIETNKQNPYIIGQKNEDLLNSVCLNLRNLEHRKFCK